MKEHFAEQLEELRRNIILMGGEVERQIHRAIEALVEVDSEKARSVIVRYWLMTGAPSPASVTVDR